MLSRLPAITACHWRKKCVIFVHMPLTFIDFKDAIFFPLAERLGVNSFGVHRTQIISLKVCPRASCPNKAQVAGKRFRATFTFHIGLVKKRKINNLPRLCPPSPSPPLPLCLSTGSVPLRTLDYKRARAHAGGSRHGNTRQKLVASVMLSWKVPDKTKRSGWQGVKGWRFEGGKSFYAFCQQRATWRHRGRVTEANQSWMEGGDVHVLARAN